MALPAFFAGKSVLKDIKKSKQAAQSAQAAAEAAAQSTANQGAAPDASNSRRSAAFLQGFGSNPNTARSFLLSG